ncbi:hypothetical protein DFH08DRAFT_824916 [Mycena albidolilacea]|uniref:Uncharacterized protein n=1 Tax=Mycena albidolilacea TaxID=1033008 RepID=A0AAD7EAJ9_9AGAR|nr:hypothetical protein DFH08DRAFT_824916 [Mycena albidolilacea]
MRPRDGRGSGTERDVDVGGRQRRRCQRSQGVRQTASNKRVASVRFKSYARRARRVPLTPPDQRVFANLQQSQWRVDQSVHTAHTPLSNNTNLSTNVPAVAAGPSWQNTSKSWENAATSTFRIPTYTPPTLLDAENQPHSPSSEMRRMERAEFYALGAQYINHSFVTGLPFLVPMYGGGAARQTHRACGGGKLKNIPAVVDAVVFRAPGW